MTYYKDNKGKTYRVPVTRSEYDQDEDLFRLSLELPGVSKDVVEILLPDSKTIKVTGDREEFYFLKVLHFPTDLDPEKIVTSFENGLLEMSVSPVVPQIKKIAVM